MSRARLFKYPRRNDTGGGALCKSYFFSTVNHIRNRVIDKIYCNEYVAPTFQLSYHSKVAYNRRKVAYNRSPPSINRISLLPPPPQINKSYLLHRFYLFCYQNYISTFSVCIYVQAIKSNYCIHLILFNSHSFEWCFKARPYISTKQNASIRA